IHRRNWARLRILTVLVVTLMISMIALTVLRVGVFPVIVMTFIVGLSQIFLTLMSVIARTWESAFALITMIPMSFCILAAFTMVAVALMTLISLVPVIG